MVAIKKVVPNPVDRYSALTTTQLQSVVHPPIVRAIDQALTAAAERTHYAVACSGGVDSAMLAVHVVLWARQHHKTVQLFHVHHGLQQRADGWVVQVHHLAQLLDVACHTQRVQVDLTQGSGMEAAARQARYSAFSQLAAHTQIDTVLLAHHLDDQAETVLLRLLRGAGPAGMGAMATHSQRQDVHYIRPLLGTARSQLLEVATKFTALCAWEPVWDPTNIQDDYTRGALRDRIVPHLNQRWPAWRQSLGRHAQQSQEAASLLAELAAEDLQRLDVGADYSFDLASWRQLSAPRQVAVLRYWLGLQGLKMPTQARLNDMLRQLRQLHQLGFDRHMRVKHGAHYVCCAQGRVFVKQAQL